MENSEFLKNWNGYIEKFVPKKRDSFTPDQFVFDAERTDFSPEISKKNAPGAWLENISFHNPDTMQDLGDYSNAPAKIEELLNFLKTEKIRMAFGYEVGRDEMLHVVNNAEEISKRDVWFIGDIHGDLLAFRSAIAFINSNSKNKPIYVLLGDLFDRNAFGLNIILEVVSLFKNAPDSVFMIAGNHDDGLAINNNRFESRIMPHEFSDYLNTIDNQLVSSFVGEFAKVIQKLPVGLVFPNGLLVTHGGVPSRPERSVKNIWEGLEAEQIKKSIESHRNEFLMNRFKGDVPLGSKISPEFSWAEIINFSHAVEKAYGVKIRSMLRGHDHCGISRHEWSKSSFKGNDACQDASCVTEVLTMTSMVLMENEETRLYHQNLSCPAVAHYIAESIMPKVYSLRLSLQDVKAYYKQVQKTFGTETLAYIKKKQGNLEEELEDWKQDKEESDRKYETEKISFENLKKDYEIAQEIFNECQKKTEESENKIKEYENQISVIEQEKNEIEERQKSMGKLKKLANGVMSVFWSNGDESDGACNLNSLIELKTSESGNLERLKKDVTDAKKLFDGKSAEFTSVQEDFNRLQRKKDGLASEGSRIQNDIDSCKKAEELYKSWVEE